MAKKEPASVSMLVLALLKGREMYGYQIIEELDKRSEHVFQMKEGTLYPVLHGLEKDRLVTAREAVTEKGRTRRYYAVTEKGLRQQPLTHPPEIPQQGTVQPSQLIRDGIRVPHGRQGGGLGGLLPHAEKGRTRRYYAVTEKGLRALEEKEKEWRTFSKAVTAILAGA
mgnify:CR=1 FL=1